MKKIVIITDLDGTLLDSETYSYAPALPALNMAAEHNVPILFCSSKTRAEIETYRERLANNHPFVSENGGGVFIPEGYFPFDVEGERRDGYTVCSFGLPYLTVRKVFASVKRQLFNHAAGFGDMTAGEVAAVTGMAESDATLAKERDFDEPFLFDSRWTGDRMGFLRCIERRGLTWTEGRLFHILGRHDKGKAAETLFGFYRRVFGEIVTIGIGDGFNDLPLLRAVDYPVLVPREDGSYAKGVHLPHLVRAAKPGPAGWNDTIMDIANGFALNI